MKFYFFSITDNKIGKIDTSAIGEPAEYLNSDSNEDIFYRVKNGAITNVMCEAEDLAAATKAVEIFLSGLTNS